MRRSDAYENNFTLKACGNDGRESSRGESFHGFYSDPGRLIHRMPVFHIPLMVIVSLPFFKLVYAELMLSMVTST